MPESVRTWELGRGETQVLSLALTLPGCRVVLDDRAARRCASVHALRMIGTVGLVAIACKKGRIPAAAPVIFALVGKGLFVDPDLIERVLADLGER